MDDVARLRAALRPVERAARSLPWADRRPWRTATHVGADGGVPIVDLHDLGARTAEQAADAIVAVAGELACGAVFVVVGRGTHSIGGAVLPEVVGARLGAACADRGWRLRTPRAGRLAVITDPTRAPDAATGALGWPMRLWLLFVLVAAVLALLRAIGAL